MKLFLLKLKHSFPLTTNGFFLLIICIYLLGYGWGSNNLYALLFSILGFLFLFLFLTINLLLKAKNQYEGFFLNTSKTIYSRLQNQTLDVVFNFYVPIFFRVHYVLTGNFIVGRKASFSCYFHESFLPSKNQKNLEIPVYFPFCGSLRCLAYVSIRDIFGLTKIRIGAIQNVNLLVLPPFFPEKPVVYVLPSTTQENLRNIKTSDQEKYFMREYIPGDRLKDINWKSSIKIQELITKISPSSPEESHLIYVEIRPYHYGDKDGPQAILQLNYLKSWILSFLRVMKKEHPNYKFHIFTGKENLILEEEKEIESFAEVLAELNYIKEGRPIEIPYTTERFIFTTGFDKNLNSYLNSINSKVYLFRVIYGKNRTVKLFERFQFQLIPKLWIFIHEQKETFRAKPKIGKVVEEKIQLDYL